MRPLARLAAVLMLLAACQLHAPAPDTSALAPEAVAVTALDAAQTTTVMNPAKAALDVTAVQVTGKATPRPVGRPEVLGSPANATSAASEPATPVPPEQALCEKTKGQWSAITGSTGHFCVHPTRDPGKSCHRKGDCQGECLAQSGTCSPIMPLMGCNAILQADGTEVTLCLQ